MAYTMPEWVLKAARDSGVESLGDFLDGYGDPGFPDRVRALPHDALAAMVIVTAEVLWKRRHRKTASK